MPGRFKNWLSYRNEKRAVIGCTIVTALIALVGVLTASPAPPKPLTAPSQPGSSLSVRSTPVEKPVGRIDPAKVAAAQAALANAQTAAQAQDALQQFLDYYGLKMQITALTPSSYVTKYDTMTTLTDADLDNIKSYGQVFMEEWSKYPADWVSNSALKGVALVKDFAVNGTHRAAGPDVVGDVMYYDVGYGDGDYAREGIHHEYDHYIEYHYFNSYSRDDSQWKSYNPPDFHYGNGGASCYTPGTCPTGQHVITGFATGYATSAIEEDKAETYAYLMTTDYYHQLQEWIKTDSGLASKVAAYKQFIAAHSTQMRGNYFDTINP